MAFFTGKPMLIIDEIKKENSMKMSQLAFRSRIQWALVPVLTLVFVGGASLLSTNEISANHPVYVEGNCLTPPAGSSPMITAGTCGDYDGDGRIGTAEDTDGDRVFGTITAALGAGTGMSAGFGANQNGRVIIVTSGTFAEVVTITSANGNTQLEAAPGVDANIDAILQGDPGGAARQAAPGIIVNAPADRFVIIRNIVSRNWTDGIQVNGSSHVLIDNCRVDNNTNFGIRVRDNARVKIDNSQVTATGFRVGAGTDFPRVNAPNPGVGIDFSGTSSGLICNTCVTNSFAAGIRSTATAPPGGGGPGFSIRVVTQNVCVFNNNPDFSGAIGQK